MNSIQETLVSIIIPVYNVEDYLIRCVKSVKKQRHKNIEIILVDDGSTDNSGKMCDKLAKTDPRIRVIHKQNAGLGEARNTGIDASGGEWVCFVDSDDFVSPNYVDLLLSAAVDNDTLMAQCRYKKGMDGVLPKLKKTVETKKMLLDEYCLYCYNTAGHSIYTCWNYIYHRSIFDNIRFSSIRHTEDVPFVQESMSLCGERGITVVDQVLYFWYQRPGSIMNRPATLNLLNQIKAYESVLDFWKSKNNKFMYDIFFATYFSCLIDDYTRMRRDIPESRSEYENITDKIKRSIDYAAKIGHGYLDVSIGDAKIFEELRKENVVMYGYGNNGNLVLPWLKYFGIEVSEIWDQSAKEGDMAGDIPIKKMPDEINPNTHVLITIQNLATHLAVKQMLINKGCKYIYESRAVDLECRKHIYSRFLPFLLKGGK